MTTPKYTDDQVYGLVRLFEALKQFTRCLRKPIEEKALVDALDKTYLASLGRMTTDRKFESGIGAKITALRAEKGSYKQHGIELAQMGADLYKAAREGRCGNADQSVKMADELVGLAQWLYEHFE